MSALRAVRHKSAQSRTQRQQEHGKHYRETDNARNKGEKETRRSGVGKLKRWREDAADGMKHRCNQNCDDKSFHNAGSSAVRGNGLLAGNDTMLKV